MATVNLEMRAPVEWPPGAARAKHERQATAALKCQVVGAGRLLHCRCASVVRQGNTQPEARRGARVTSQQLWQHYVWLHIVLRGALRGRMKARQDLSLHANRSDSPDEFPHAAHARHRKHSEHTGRAFGRRSVPWSCTCRLCRVRVALCAGPRAAASGLGLCCVCANQNAPD